MLMRQKYRWFLLVLGLVLRMFPTARAEDLPPETLRKPSGSTDQTDIGLADRNSAILPAEYWQNLAQSLGVPPVYSAAAIEAWVVDADTGQPLEGVIVTANWELDRLIFRGYPVGQMMVMETVTDAKGRFYFPAWGPRPRPLDGLLDYQDPQLLLFKSGYEFARVTNTANAPLNTSPLREPHWNGKIIKLKKFTGSLPEYSKKVAFLDELLEFAFRHHDCSWKHVPQMLTAIHQERLRLDEKGIPSNLQSIEDREGRNTPDLTKCGSVKQFLRSYLPS